MKPTDLLLGVLVAPEAARAWELVKRVGAVGQRYGKLRGHIGPFQAPEAVSLLDEASQVLGQLFEAARKLPDRGSWSSTLPELEQLVDRAEVVLRKLEACRVS